MKEKDWTKYSDYSLNVIRKTACKEIKKWEKWLEEIEDEFRRRKKQKEKENE